ncbi:cyclin-dependent kinase inhibitor 1Ba [Megalobrama amblycephala]|uniref:cyclin-dependent kinase inhibitor 1Ba n=1 Tax=Megalobrama amblycephala TaxID=75352 RepID=UPI0020142369|nr:cyclin-dependent kinase inhibitor 1Ba [Megalobrama amblycephala]
MCKMSKVRVSNGSPTLERVDARQADHAKPPVCRNLFGTVDREEFARDVEEQMREIEKASKEKWNYDFAKNEPLEPGNYEWQEVDAKEVPEFYTRPPHVKRATSTGTVDHNGNHDYLLTTPSLESVGGDSDSTETGSRTDCRTALSTPRKRPSTEDQDLPSQSKRPNVHATETNRCPDTTSSPEREPSKSDPKT